MNVRKKILKFAIYNPISKISYLSLMIEFFFSFISLVLHNTYWRGLFYDDDFTQYLTAIKSTIHHQSNLCYLDNRSTNCILISSII